MRADERAVAAFDAAGGERRPPRLRALEGARNLGARHHDDELLAADPADEVRGPHVAEEDVGEPQEDAVAHRVAVRRR